MERGVQGIGDLGVGSIAERLLVVLVDDAVAVKVDIDGITVFEVEVLVRHVGAVSRLVTILGAGLIELEEVIAERLSDRKAGVPQVFIHGFDLEHLDHGVPGE